jgi:ubiquinone/menaquinone biosynthesis C-methylase UbiE
MCTFLAQASFQVADALKQPFPDGQFDLVWSMESGEHMPNKPKVNELLLSRNLTVRVTGKP